MERSSALPTSRTTCARGTTDAEAATLDLRTWRDARIAGEVVRSATAERFTARFVAAGFGAEGL
ncbi:hypothetical protein OG407_00560 [Streptomyces sp. NBC_01515]|uniref:hypothetical protein n=1 Tax=Streptomyces sp. NBC_01515 TaxID=2903890 RepID=UPI00386DDD0E